MAELEKSESKKRLSSQQNSDDDEPKNKKRAMSPSPETADDDGNTSWNVDECRGDHESVEHWELRKQFLVENMGRFPKPRLICLSQVFANMEFLGCRYPEQTMELVNELSLGIVESYREKQKNRLQRTFVKASSAAERKTKGPGSKKPDGAATSNNSPSINSRNVRPTHNVSTVSRTPAGNHSISDLRRLILLVYAYNPGESAICIIHRSCAAANVPIVAEFSEGDGLYTCIYHVGPQLTVKSEGFHSKERAKGEAARNVFENLRQQCYIFVTKLRILPDSDEKEVAKTDIEKKHAPSNHPTLSEDNVGNKLLKLMGWSGGGLGKNEQGINEAISVDGVVGRSRLGLGNTSGATFFKKVSDLLQEHRELGFPYDLKFSTDFSKDERKEIHMIAQRLGMKSKSYGKDEDRYIVISEKTTRQDLLQNILAKGGNTEKYQVIPPGGNIEGIETLIM